MRKYMVLCLTAALLISGCLNQTNESADTSTETEEYVLSTPDTYKNLESFIYHIRLQTRLIYDQNFQPSGFTGSMITIHGRHP